jgi:hypothetical protein
VAERGFADLAARLGRALRMKRRAASISASLRLPWW